MAKAGVTPGRGHCPGGEKDLDEGWDYKTNHLGVSIVMAVPNSWRVYVMENPIYKWMMTRGFRKLPEISATLF